MGYPIYGGVQPQQVVPMVPQQFPTQQPTIASYPMDADGKIWVQGISGAKAYLMAPGRTATLWDAESKTIYLKSADATGMPSMRILDYEFREDKPVETPKYVSIDEFNSLRSELDELRKQIRHNNPRPEGKFKKEGGKL